MRTRVTQRLLGSIIALAVVFSALSSGRTFLWCKPMQRAMSHCCGASIAPDIQHASPVMRGDCCESRVIPALPLGDMGGDASTHVPLFDLSALPMSTGELASARPPTVIAIARDRGTTARPRAQLHVLYRVFLI
ncbi:MAG: hypothetical protein IPK60_01645 [Sandaracinaceae bacterium]|nr:hypothetical protein [Sandaracinaceae bacterium]